MSALAPCPHCGVAMGGDDSYMTHPKNDCFWSEWEFDQPNVDAWNRRAPLPAEQPSNPVPQFLVRKLEQAIYEAKNPKGMHTNGPTYAHIEVSQLEAIMARIVGQQTKGGGNAS